MRQEDATPHALVGRAGLVFAFVCFAFGLSMFGGAIYFLPLTIKAKLFLAAAALLLASMFAFMAIATFLVLRPRGGSPARRPDQKGVGGEGPADADGSHRLR